MEQSPPEVPSNLNSSAMLIFFPRLQQFRFQLSAAQRTRPRGEGGNGGDRQGCQPPALPGLGAELQNQAPYGCVCNPVRISACPRTGHGQSFPCFQQSCINRTRLSCKNVCLCFKPSSPVSEKDHQPMQWDPNTDVYMSSRLPAASSQTQSRSMESTAQHSAFP